MAELAKYLPAVKETLIDERDRYLATKIWEAALSTEGTVLAVVGAGHLRGIQTCLEKFAEGEAPAALETLESIPPRSWLSAAAKWIIPVAIASLITVGFIRADLSEFLNKLVVYILWNGGLAALGAVIALGHPLAIGIISGRALHLAVSVYRRGDTGRPGAGGGPQAPRLRCRIHFNNRRPERRIPQPDKQDSAGVLSVQPWQLYRDFRFDTDFCRLVGQVIM